MTKTLSALFVAASLLTFGAAQAADMGAPAEKPAASAPAKHAKKQVKHVKHVKHAKHAKAAMHTKAVEGAAK